MTDKKRSIFSAVFLSIIASSLSILSQHPARADDSSDFFKGKTLTLIISSAPGGGYDTLARLVARHISKHIPGEPTIIARDVPAAGGIVAANMLYNSLPKDGSAFGLLLNTTPFEPLFGSPGVKFDPSKFIWMGSPNSVVGLLGVWKTVPINSLADLRTHEITVGADASNSTQGFYARLLNETLGLKLKIVVGYSGQMDVFLAMQRGEIDGAPSIFYDSLLATEPSWLPEKSIKLLVQYGAAPETAIASVPFAADLVKDGSAKRLLETAVAPLALGRPFVLPPDTPTDRVAVLRKALAETFADPQFRSEAESMKIGVKTPQSGTEIADAISRAYSAPPDIVARLRSLAQGN